MLKVVLQLFISLNIGPGHVSIECCQVRTRFDKKFDVLKCDLHYKLYKIGKTNDIDPTYFIFSYYLGLIISLPTSLYHIPTVTSM